MKSDLEKGAEEVAHFAADCFRNVTAQGAGLAASGNLSNDAVAGAAAVALTKTVLENPVAKKEIEDTFKAVASGAVAVATAIGPVGWTVIGIGAVGYGAYKFFQWLDE